ncbi:MAG: hypothetical protein ACYDHM_06865 [Acidiferrobacterales bacterium]
MLAVLTRTAVAITPAALHALVRRDAQTERARERSVRPGNLAALVPPVPRRRRARPASAAAAGVRSPPRSALLRVRAVPWAAPAPEFSRQAVIYSDAVMPATRPRFGIRLGTWMTARLPIPASSADPGQIELVLSRTVHGTRRVLPAGTLLFCEKRLNGATRRMELIAVQGITPGGKQFRLRGRVFDTARIPGLSGVVSVDAARMLRRSAGRGVLAAGSAAVGSLLGQNGAGAAAAGAATETMLSDSGRMISGRARRAHLIDVAPQPVLIRVEATF